LSFQEVAEEHESVCAMHHEFLKGMFEALFESVELVEKENIISGCETCSYQALVTN
jgi:predicted ArsR family transcriptional regulator